MRQAAASAAAARLLSWSFVLWVQIHETHGDFPLFLYLSAGNTANSVEIDAVIRAHGKCPLVRRALVSVGKNDGLLRSGANTF